MLSDDKVIITEKKNKIILTEEDRQYLISALSAKISAREAKLKVEKALLAKLQKKSLADQGETPGIHRSAKQQ